MSTVQFVSFVIDSNLCGINILNVREINSVLDITPVQHAPDYVRGLINLRGQTVTVCDLGVRLGLEPRTITSETKNIILKEEDVALLVDSIGDVVEVEEDEIRPSPANFGDIEREFMDGIVRLESQLLIILSAKRLIAI
ncbi:MAG: chemotaxis protein CheW [Desulfobacterales bacterium]|nr:chemotaxis protein CheW [Desulfobacterales bacterium]